jgi:hypothetical protein
MKTKTKITKIGNKQIKTTNEFIVWFGGMREFEDAVIQDLSSAFYLISESLFMLDDDRYEFDEKSITIEIKTTVEDDENYNYTYMKFLEIKPSQFKKMQKHNLSF